MAPFQDGIGYSVERQDGVTHHWYDATTVTFERDGVLAVWGMTDGAENCGTPQILLLQAYSPTAWKGVQQIRGNQTQPEEE
mgnify:CR=1 FL=1